MAILLSRGREDLLINLLKQVFFVFGECVV